MPKRYKYRQKQNSNETRKENTDSTADPGGIPGVSGLRGDAVKGADCQDVMLNRIEDNINLKTLQKLESLDLEDLILEIVNNTEKIKLFAIRKDLQIIEVLLMTNLLATVCRSPLKEVKVTILTMFLNDTFIYNLYKVMDNVSTQSDLRKQGNQFWEHLIEICGNILNLVSDPAITMLHVLLNALKINIPVFEYTHKIDVSDHVKKRVEEMTAQLLIKEKNRKAKDKKNPPDDFHRISIYPTSSEVLNNESFFRANVTEKPYHNLDHYLDVQFRLIREDFLRPLRRGIKTCISSETKPGQNIRIYKEVTFVRIEPVNENYCVLVRLPFQNYTKRFMYGSLVCFSRDNFKMIVFGRIVETSRDSEAVIEFDTKVPVLFDEPYTMIESKIYFEPYFQVLKALQNVSSSDEFPLEKYIVRLDLTPAPPKYLTEDDPRYKIKGHMLSPLEDYWPEEITNLLKLNEAQLLAFKSALTQEFSIIHGPPGTGKTYLGLAITKTLLQNQLFWHKRSPILVICYTNHALDQFLEGVLKYTEKVVRVGGRSKSEKLQKYTLKGLSRTRNCSFFQKLSQLKKISAKMKEISVILEEIDSFRSVIAFDRFEEEGDMWLFHASKNAIVTWLMAGREEATKSTQKSKYKYDFGLKAIDRSSPEEEKEFTIISLKSIGDEIATLEKSFKTSTPNNNSRKLIEDKITDLKNKYYYLSMRLHKGKKNKNKISEEPKDVNSLNTKKIGPDDRWNLYFCWLKSYKIRLLETLDSLCLKYQSAYKEYDELRHLETTKSLRGALVVGMTTSGAARLRPALESLKCPIVIVEEAAEILEAHIIACLTQHCQQLILIGDHQQLRPKTADISIENRFKLGISLLERMIINSSPDQYCVLKIQHRMRPEIANLISMVYPFLENHPSVTEREPIKGIDTCLFFIDHTNVEDCVDGSMTNVYEISFFIYLAKYLILNGYTSKQITILSAYVRQVRGFEEEAAKHKDLQNIRISLLDNYQGEESDIILLSLVRNNNENKIGFLSTENRICVALSRARNGFYIMGNLPQLSSESDLWIKVGAVLFSQDSIGPKLRLRCQVHPDVVTSVGSDEDFMNIPNGGCTRKCGKILECGHECTLVCHTENMDHKEYRCEEECNRLLCDLDIHHKCQKKCFQKCGPCKFLVLKTLPCGHRAEIECRSNVETYKCLESVPVELPCAHTASKLCHQDPNTIACSEPCDEILDCGHTCGLSCHVETDPNHLKYKCKKRCVKYLKDCSVKDESHKCRKFCYEVCDPCTILVKKQRRLCPHVQIVPCNENSDDLKCAESCTKILDCGHQCKKPCCDPCGDCDVKVSKTHPICGHSFKVKCREEPDRKLCNKKCPLKLPCNHTCVAKCNEPCTVTCTTMVDCCTPTECGHFVTKMKCNIAKNSRFLQDGGKLPAKHCNKPCYSILKCGHPCSGNCSDCFQGRFHKKCEQKCNVLLICNHQIEVPCYQTCNPCSLKCFYKCQHNSCSKKCSEVCTPCKKKCPRNCAHQKCTEKCGEICSIAACEEPCEKKLKCGHDCIGFCGDPCPMQCFECDDLKEKGRHVLLNDCKHIVKHSEMKIRIEKNEDQVEFNTCPECSAPVITTQRYSDHAKKTMAEISRIKLELKGSAEENDELLYNIQTQFFLLKQKCQGLSLVSLKITPTLLTLESYLTKIIKNKQKVCKNQLDTIGSKLSIIEYIVKSCESVINPDKYLISQINFMLNILKSEQDNLTKQEVEDIYLETEFFFRMVDFNQIENQFENLATEESLEETKTELVQCFKAYERFSREKNAHIIELLKQLNFLVPSKIIVMEREDLKMSYSASFKKIKELPK